MRFPSVDVDASRSWRSKSPTSAVKRERVSQFLGLGCLIQSAGLAAPIAMGLYFGPKGVVAGLAVLLALYFAGASKLKPWRCGNCKRPLSTAMVRVCPHCGALLSS